MGSNSLNRKVFFEFLFWEKAQIKQAWYRCSELINKSKSARKINNTYKDTKNTDSVKTSSVDQSWLINLSLPEISYLPEEDWRYQEMLGWFDKYGIEFFEPLDIWHIEKFNQLFLEKAGRAPKPVFYPRIITKLNDLKNRIKNDYL